MSNELYLNDTQLNDPINDLQDGIVDPSQVEEQTPPGFFQTLRNPMELIFEESLPASLYQYATGNTKKVQAERALKFLQRYPQLQNTGQYKEAERIYKKFGYLLEDGEQSFDASEILKMAKKYPSAVGAELVNMLIADPYLILLPATVFSKLGRGMVNAGKLKYSNKFKSLPTEAKDIISLQAKRDIKHGAMASVLLPFAFSTGLQLGEKGEISASRTTAETTFGATAGLLMSLTFGGISALASRDIGINPAKFNESFVKRVNSYKNPLDALEFNENGAIKSLDDTLKDLRATIKDLDPVTKYEIILGGKTFKFTKAEAEAASITSNVRTVRESAYDAIKSSAIKASSLGTIGAVAQFLTEEDEKLKESLIGFGAGVSVYAAYKGLAKAFGWAKKVPQATVDFEIMEQATNILNAKVNSEVGNIIAMFKNVVPEPTSRRKIFHYIQGTTVDDKLNYSSTGRILTKKDLTKLELEGAEMIRKTLDTIYDTLQKEFTNIPFTFNYRSNYLPLIFEDFRGANRFNYTDETIRSFGNASTSSRFFYKRTFDSINEALKVGKKIKPGMDDPAELLRVYTFALSKALTNKNLIHYLKNKNIIIGKTANNNPISLRLFYTKQDRQFIPKNYQEQFKPYKHRILGDQEVYVHQDIIKSLEMIFDASDEPKLIGGLFTINLMMKRLAVAASFFHAGALVESMIFAGNSFKTIGKFLNPRSKQEILQMIENPLLQQNNFKNILNIKEENMNNLLTAANKFGFKNLIDFAKASNLKISTPEDIGFDRFYANIRQTEQLINHQFGFKTTGKIEKVFKWFDRITWDRLFSQAKIYTFLRQLDKIVKPGDTKSVVYNKAKIAAQFTNDAFGGQDWVAITQKISNPIFKKLAQTLFAPGSRGYMQLLMFAPDWTISNIRIIAKSLPLFEPDPIARSMYQAYFAKAALMYGTIGTALNYIFSGKSQLENKDPTRIDLGDGQVLTFSKQLMEPFHWITDPQNTALKKIGSVPRAIIEILTNKEYLTTKWSPNLTTKDDTAIEKAIKIGGKAGEKFLPIWLLSSVRTISDKYEQEGISPDLASDVALDFVLGQLGHPRYKGPRTSAYKLKGLVRSPYETLF
jgi:hypothetical protein